MPVGPGAVGINPDGSVAASVVQTVVQPAAGADWTFTYTGPPNRLLIGAQAQFVTSAAVANRVPLINIRDGAGNFICSVSASAAQTATTTQKYNLMPGGSPNLFGGRAIIPMPYNLAVGNGWTIGTSTSAIDVADQWSLITVIFAGP